jgi:sugar lactone lactonase YvrE
MRSVWRWLGAIVILLAGWAAPAPLAQAANLDTTADRVFGQPDFSQHGFNDGGLSAASLERASSVALDRQGNLYVADSYNNRVLEYDAPLSSSMAASRVIGQPSFITNTVNNGGLSAASLNSPTGVALDAQGNLYVADTYNSRVLEYDAPLTSHQAADRVIGQPSFVTNTANTGGISDASLSLPTGLALDAQGNLYVADFFNNRVLEYDTPLSAGATADRVFGQPSFVTNTVSAGNPSALSLHRPGGVALDAQGNLYVTDNYNSRVLEYDAPLTSDAAADRVFGQPDFNHNTYNNGGPSATSLAGPGSVALDAAGNLYVSDNENNRVLEYDAPLTTGEAAKRVFGQGGSFTTGTPNKGGVSADSLFNPAGVALDSHGNLYAADLINNRILEYDQPVPYGVPKLESLSPKSVAAGSTAFTLTISGAGFVPGSSVRWGGSDRPTTFVDSTRLSASIPAADVAAVAPAAVTVFTPAPGGGTSTLINMNVYARAEQDARADTEQGQPDFASLAANNPLVPAADGLSSPAGVAVDGRTGRLFVADSGNNRVLSWATARAQANGQQADLVLGQPDFNSTDANHGGLSATSLSFPYGLALDAQGDLYVADVLNSRVLEYDAPLSSHMAASRVFGQGGSFTTGVANNGGVSANSLNGPTAVAVDARGDLYVADLGNSRVLEFDTPVSAGTTADRVFGQPDMISNLSNNGGLSADSLATVFGVATDPQGHLYVADNGNNRVLEYDAPLSAERAADRVFGQPSLITNTANYDGISADSLFDPIGVATDSQGHLYVADTGNNRLLEYDAPLASGRAADRVFGQPSMLTGTANIGGVSALSLNFPTAAALDAQGNLYLADNGNNRVLEFDRPLPLLGLFLPLLMR